MDPSQLNSLDPKLREAYERVMKAGVSATPTPPAQTNTPTATAASQTAQPTPSVSVAAQQASGHDPLDAMAHASSRFTADSAQPTTPAVQTEPSQPVPVPAPVQPVEPAPIAAPTPAAPPPPPATMVNQTVASEQVHAYVADEVAGVKNSLKFIQIMYIVGGAIFFIVYALFWMKFFNVASPF